MKYIEIEKPILALFSLVIVEIIWSGVYGLTSSWQQQTFFLGAQTLPLSVALPGLWRFKYWAWILAIVVACGELFGLVSIIPDWSTHFALYCQSPIKATYMYIILPIIDIVILALLVIERDYFD